MRNRVDPTGALHDVPQRMGWFGNRGCLHDAAGTIRRAHQGRRWITCLLSFNGRHRAPMPPGRYTGLFFLDEATACAAGHRPCAECRRADWLAFRRLWQAEYGEDHADAIDARLHAARLDGRARRLVPVPAAGVPVGAMVLHRGAALLRGAGGWYRWSFDGYTGTTAPEGMTDLLTPLPLARLMARGWAVQQHDTAR